MAERTIVPFGPQHPVLPEPIHLDLVMEDEKVVEVIPSIGYVHRGLESLTKKKDFNELVYVIERTCGICSFGHGLGYCMTIEDIMGVEVPRRADYLRTIWFEMSRLHSHLLWLGLLADGFGFEALFMHAWRLREDILNMLETSTGGRVIFSVNKVGGVLKDMPKEMLDKYNLDGVSVHQVYSVYQEEFDNFHSNIHATKINNAGVDQYLSLIKESDEALEQFEAASPEIEELIAYYESDLWREDFEADEEGILPKDLKRGVLSEDGIYNLLTDYQRLLH